MSLFVVLGATGHQGSAVIRYFIAHHDRLHFRLRGTTRDVNSPAARELQALGVEMVGVDFANIDSVVRAFRGATHIFANTDSNQSIFKAIKDPSLCRPGQCAAEYGVEEELKHAKNIVEAAAAAESLERIIWSSLPSPRKRSSGKYPKVVMFDTKDRIKEIFLDNPRLQKKVSILINAFYLDNAVRVPDLYAPKRSADGVYELSFPMSGDAPVPVTDVTADEGIWVEALFAAPVGIILLGVTEITTWSRWLRSWGQALQVPTRYVRAEAEHFASHMHGLHKAITEEFQYVGEFGFTGDDVGAITLDEINPAFARRISSVDQHLQRTDWSQIVKADQ